MRGIARLLTLAVVLIFVVGEAGEKYYTPNHYESFLFIIEGK